MFSTTKHSRKCLHLLRQKNTRVTASIVRHAKLDYMPDKGDALRKVFHHGYCLRWKLTYSSRPPCGNLHPHIYYLNHLPMGMVAMGRADRCVQRIVSNTSDNEINCFRNIRAGDDSRQIIYSKGGGG